MNVEKMYTTIDAHVSGEAFRVIIHSPLQLSNQGLAKDKAAGAVTQAKQLLLNEPRGHRGINGCIIYPSDKADFAVEFINHQQENDFSYGGLVATLTVLLETGQLTVAKNGTYAIETIKGVHALSASVENQVVRHIQVDNKGCHVLETEWDDMQLVEIDGARRYFLYALPTSIPSLDINHLSAIMKWGKEMVDNHKNETFNGIVLIENRTKDSVRSVTFETDGVILRSPGFDSTYAIFAGRRNNGKNSTQLTNESIFGSSLKTAINDDSKSGSTIKTQAFVTGEHRFLYDPEDPLKNGFLLR